MRISRPIVLAVLGLALPLAAQGNTWIVDAAGGGNFLDLPAAVATVASGDTLIVRAGSYTGFTTSKALTVLGEGTVVVQRFELPVFPPVISVSGLAPGTTFVMKNLRVQPVSSSPSAVSLGNNRGRVHLEDVVIDGAAALFGPAGLEVSGCDEVTVTGGSIYAWPAIFCGASVLALTGVTVHGGDAPWAAGASQVAREGLVLVNSTALLSRTDVRGGSGSFNPGRQTPAVAIDSSQSDLTVTGEAGTIVQAGGRWSTVGPFPTAAIQTMQGTVTADTQIQIVGTDGGPPIGGTATVLRQRVASLWASGAPLSGTAQVELVSPANEPIAIFVGLTGDPVPLLGSLLFFDVAVPVIPLLVGTQQPSEKTVRPFGVPANPALRGLPVAVQAVHFHTARSFLEFTNPAVIVFD